MLSISTLPLKNGDPKTETPFVSRMKKCVLLCASVSLSSYEIMVGFRFALQTYKRTATLEKAKKSVKTTMFGAKSVTNVMMAMPAQLHAAPTPIPKALKSIG